MCELKWRWSDVFLLARSGLLESHLIFKCRELGVQLTFWDEAR